MRLTARNAAPSLTRQTLLKMAMRIALVIILTTAISYYHVMAVLRAQALEQLQKYVHERTQRESSLFMLARDNHQVLKADLLARLAQAKNTDPRDRFARLISRSADGVLRNRPQGFDGRRQAGIYIDRALKVNADLRRRVVTFYDLCQSYGPAWHNRFQDTYFTTPENLIVLYWPEVPTWAQDAKADFDMRKEEYVSVADRQHDPTRQLAWTGVYYDKVGKTWMISAETPVEQDGRHIATIGHDILLNELLNRTINNHLAGTYNVLLRTDGRLIAHPQKMRELEAAGGDYDITRCADPHLRHIFQAVKTGRGETAIVDNAADGEYLAVARLDEIGWYFVTVYPKSLITAKAFAATRFILLLGLLALALELTILFFVLRGQIARPLLQFIAATERVAEGNLAVQLDTARRDELGSLAKSFQAMAHAVAERDAQLEAQNAELEKQVAARTAALQEANARLEALATTDPLTGLPNHRALVAVMDKELERSARFNRPCSLLFLDLDHFKSLNDGCGHAAGDIALRELGMVIRTGLRGMDTLGRWGGEEFIALLPETDAEDALLVAERIRALVAAHLFTLSGGVHLTCSLGVSSYPADAADRSQLIEAADQAMYAAKQLGRNQARAISDPAVTALDKQAHGGSREDTALLGMVEALSSLVNARDRYTGEHTDEVADLASRLALAMGMDANAARVVGLVGRLHDIGKVAIPDAILQKPGKLTEEEWTLMRLHPVIGADVVDRVPSLRMVAPGIRGHHERWDGSGYPDSLQGEAIPLSARIVSVADAYGAMTTDRPYRRALDTAWALEELRRCAGTQFDPQVVEALAKVLAASDADAKPKAA